MIQPNSWAKQVKGVSADDSPYIFVTGIIGTRYFHRHLGSSMEFFCALDCIEELTLEDIAYLYCTQTIEDISKGGEDGKSTG